MNRLYRTAKELLSSNQLNECHDVLSRIIKECSGDDTNGGLTRPELADIYNMRGHIKYLWVDFNEAIDDYSQSIRLNPSIAIPYYNRGQIHYRMGRYELAQTDLMEALRLNPHFTDAALNLEQVQKDLASNHRFNI